MSLIFDSLITSGVGVGVFVAVGVGVGVSVTDMGTSVGSVEGVVSITSTGTVVESVGFSPHPVSVKREESFVAASLGTRNDG